jgi:hypothetical protein
MLNVIMLSVVKLNVVAPSYHPLNHHKIKDGQSCTTFCSIIHVLVLRSKEFQFTSYKLQFPNCPQQFSSDVEPVQRLS